MKKFKIKKICIDHHLLRLQCMVLFNDIIVMDGVGLVENELILLNFPFSSGLLSILLDSFGGFSMYLGKGVKNPP